MSSLSKEQRQYAQKIESELKSSMRPITIGDASAATGVSMREAKTALDYLIEKYDCRLKITENADLIYDFGSSFHRRGERTWTEWWDSVQAGLWKAFMIFFKIWITITLIVYFIIFLIILITFIIALFVAMSRGGSDSDDSPIDLKGCGGIFNIFGELIQNLFIWNTINNSYHYETDSRGYRYRAYDSRASTLGKLRKGKKGKGFVASVYDFVFGQPRYEIHPLENQQEAAAFLRKNKGIIVKSELVALAGWTAEKAEKFFSEIIVKFNGDSAISENKILYGDFYELTRSKSKEADAEIIYYWNEYEPEYKLTGNKSGRNFWIAFLNAFNLTFAFLILSDVLIDVLPDLQAIPYLHIILGWVPLVFSVIFFLVPMLRAFSLGKKRRRRRLDNIRKRLIGTVFKNRLQSIPLNSFTKMVNEGAKEEKLSEKKVKNMMEEVARDLEGEISIDPNGNILYKFNFLNEEMQEAERLRQKRDSGENLGNILLDSHE